LGRNTIFNACPGVATTGPAGASAGALVGAGASVGASVGGGASVVAAGVGPQAVPSILKTTSSTTMRHTYVFISFSSFFLL
jgi:hypothetical protein